MYSKDCLIFRLYITINWVISVCVCLSGYTFPHSSTDLLQIWREPFTGHDTFRVLYILCAHAMCACVLSARTCVHSLIFERILSKFAGNRLRLTISGKDCVLFIFTHRAHACERACARVRTCVRARMCARARTCASAHACARARVIKRSLIYGRIIFKFTVNILQVTSSSNGYILFMFTHCVHACERAHD
jgi:hypothetical protein